MKYLAALLTAFVLLTGSAHAAPTYKSLQWNLHFIHAYRAWGVATTEGAGVKVCDVDTGIAQNNPDFTGAIAGAIDLAEPGSPASVDDNEGHGTHVSGTIMAHGANIYGVAPKASLLMAKVFDATGSSSSAKVTGGIFWCIAQGAQVINLSLGGTADVADGLAQVIRYACSKNIDIAAASGNDSDSAAADPAAVDSPCLIATNAVDEHGVIAHFSNFDENQRTVAAPGQNILSDSPDGLVQYDSGTSMASPHVAGVLALLRGMGLNATTAVNVVLASTRKPTGVPFSDPYSIRTYYGYGYLDAYRAVLMARSLLS